MKIKNLQIYALVTTVLTVVMMVALITIISVDQITDTYVEEVYVTDRINDLYFVTFENGHNFGFYSDDEIELGEVVYVTVDTKGTKTVKDDEITNVRVDKTFSIKNSETT